MSNAVRILVRKRNGGFSVTLVILAESVRPEIDEHWNGDIVDDFATGC